MKTTSGLASVHSPMLNKGGTWSYTFTTAGTYGYVCTVHPGMTAQLVVLAAAAQKPTTAAPAHRHSDSSGPTKSTAPRTPDRGTTSAHPHDTASAAAVPAASSSPPFRAQSTAPTVQAQVPIGADSAASARPLDPLLVLAGVVAGIAVNSLNTSLVYGTAYAGFGEGFMIFGAWRGGLQRRVWATRHRRRGSSPSSKAWTSLRVQPSARESTR